MLSADALHMQMSTLHKATRTLSKPAHNNTHVQEVFWHTPKDVAYLSA